MNIRLTFLLVAVLVIFGGTFLIFRFTDLITGSSGDSAENRPWLFRVDEDSIMHIEISHAGRTVNYDRKPGTATWFIQENGEETLVSQDKWSGTLLLLTGPKVNRVVASSFPNPSSYGLEPPETVVKISERSGLSYEFHIGSPTPNSENQYVYLVGDPTLFTVPQIWAQVINKLADEPPYPPASEGSAGDQVLLFRVDEDSVVHIQVSHAGRTVDYDRKPGTTTWFIQENGEETQVFQEKWSGTLPLLTSPLVDRVVEASFDNPVSYGLEPPESVVKIIQRSGQSYEFHIGNPSPNGENQYVSLAGDPTLFTVPQIWAQMINNLADEPPYPPTPEEERAAGSG